MSNFLKNRFSISAICFLILLIAIVVLLIFPSISEIQLINSQVHEERERLERLYTKGQIRKQVKKNFKSIEEKTKFLDNMILEENKELEYITAAENIAEKHNLDISMATGKIERKPEQNFSELKFTFSLTGDWEDVLRWIDGVESLPYYTNILEISASARKQGAETASRVLNAKIKASTYWLVAE